MAATGGAGAAHPTSPVAPGQALDRAACAALDARDPLADQRALFHLPEDLFYLDGNSLGPLPHAVGERVRRVLSEEWGDGLIRSWNTAGWIDLPARVGARIAPLIGAAADEVIVADSTSLNLFKLLAAALRLRPERRVILSQTGNFPTDLYMAQGLVALLDAGYELRTLPHDEIVGALDEDVAVLMLTHVDYHSGRMYDMAAVTEAAHAAGALMLWDLAHSAGAVPVDLGACSADLAVGCGYKYLNGGPGAPAFLFVRRDLQPRVEQPLTGWLGHAAPFEFTPDYVPGPGMIRHLCGTPPVLSLAALDAALTLWSEVDLAALRAKSVAMCELFIALVERECAGHGLRLASPRAAAERGSQVCFAHPEGYAIVQALIDRGVIGDFRTPDILRFGFTPLYLRYVDVFDAVAILREVMETRAWDEPRFKARAAVT